MEEGLEGLVRDSLNAALVRSPESIDAALAEFGWNELAETDEAFAFTALFEAQGRLLVDSPALDVTSLARLGIDDPGVVIWPWTAPAADGAAARSGELAIEGIALRSVSEADTSIFVPALGTLHRLAPSRIDEAPLGGMASGSAWRKVRARGESVSAHGSWAEIERRARLAVASELVGVSQRILEVATNQVGTRRQFGRPIGTYQAVRHRLAEAYAELTGARALVAAAWEDGADAAAAWAKAVAGAAGDAVAKHAIQVCGAIGLDEEHELPRLVRRRFMLDALLGPVGLQPESFGRQLMAAPSPAVGRF